MTRFIPQYTYHSPPGVQIWEWCTCDNRSTKIGGIRCKISLKKGSHSVEAPKIGSSSLWAQKQNKTKQNKTTPLQKKQNKKKKTKNKNNGGYSVCENTIFSARICNFYAKIALKMCLKCVKMRANFFWFLCKILFLTELGVGMAWCEKRGSNERQLISTNLWECPLGSPLTYCGIKGSASFFFKL